MADEYLAERLHLTIVAGLDGYWATITGGDPSREVGRVRDGGQKRAALIIGDTTLDDLVVGRPFERSRDQPIERRLRQLLNAGQKFTTSVSSYDTDADFIRIGDPRDWEVELKTVRGPEGNRESNNPKRLELVFACR